MKHWGYPDLPADTVVRMDVPADLAEAVSAFVQDPDAFVETVRGTGDQRPPVAFAQVDGVWFDPSRLIVVGPRPGGCIAFFEHQASLNIDVTPDEFMEILHERLTELSEVRERMQNPDEKDT